MVLFSIAAYFDWTFGELQLILIGSGRMSEVVKHTIFRLK